MGDVKNQIKKVLSNKNTLTLLIVLAGIIALYAVYNNRVNSAITTIKVPYAKKAINSRTLITSDYIGYTEIPKNVANTLGILATSGAVLNGYVAYGETIPVNSFFYPDVVTTFEEVATSEFANIPDGYTVYSLDVDINSTYGNSIYTGNYIDLYVKAINDNRQIIFGRLFKQIQVLSVVDKKGNDVFESSDEDRAPSKMFFAVPDEFFTLLRKAEFIAAGVEVMPIPRNKDYQGETAVDSQYIQNYILSKSVTLNN